MKKDFIDLTQLSSQEIQSILSTALEMKKDRDAFSDVLLGKNIGLLFQKPSNRTRVSFEVGIRDLGGSPIYLSPQEINLGVRETVSDVAQTLSRYLDGLIARTNRHIDLLDLAQYGTIPVVNALTDESHPCQAMADLLTILEHKENLKGLTLAYVGDGNNVCHSVMLACVKAGISVHVATPKGYEPEEKFIAESKKIAIENGVSVWVTNSAEEAVKDVDVIYTDVWVSMGQEAQAQDRLSIFDAYQVNESLVKHAKDDYIFLHCLPAHRGQEVTEGVIDGPNSVVFDQAENRLHAQKAVLKYLYS